MPLPWSGSRGSSFISWPITYCLLPPFSAPRFASGWLSPLSRTTSRGFTAMTCWAPGWAPSASSPRSSGSSRPRALRVVGGLGFLAAALASWQEVGARRWWRTAAYLIGAALVYAAVPTSWTALRFSEYKELAQALLIPGTEVVREESSPLGLLKVIRSPLIPLRYAPGLSLSNSIEPPPQLGVFTDGGGLSPITAFDGGLEPLAYLDYTSAALPYHLLERPEALIIGAGGGADVLLALYHRAARIDAVELNPQQDISTTGQRCASAFPRGAASSREPGGTTTSS